MGGIDGGVGGSRHWGARPCREALSAFGVGERATTACTRALDYLGALDPLPRTASC